MAKEFLDFEGLEVYNDAIKEYIAWYIDTKLPTPSSADNGKVLGVVGGKYNFITPTSTNLANVEEATFNG